MLVETIDNKYQLRDRFIDYNRDYYSLDAYGVIFDYYNEFEENIELDVIAICGDFNELSFEEFINDYDVEIEEDEEIEEAIINYLDNNGGFYQILDNTVIYTVF